ncbi:MAG: radical SAM protein, partial [Crocinitomicaceae bacterium]|nr:radical SAM protein [Crocinitomicaceae bacterium]
MNKLTIYLADLRHNYLGYVSSDAMPLGIGYMKSVMKNRFPDFDIQLFAYPNDLESQMKKIPPDILMLTNYIWNEKISLHFARYLKKHHPKSLVIMGGPNIPVENSRRIEYLKKNDFIDLYALGEGDFYATEIVQLYVDSNFDIKQLLANHIHSSIYKCKSEVVVSEVIPRSKNLDEIPSPWLNGIMDQFFDGMLVPLYETNRGCPFSCSFCVQGSKWYSKVFHFSLERIEEEIEYIAKKISTDFPQQKMIRIADPNFGMFARDIEIASYLGETQKKYNYPLLIDATTGKNRADNIIKTMEEVNGALIFYQAVQSLDDEVLENIQRSNIKLDSYKDLQIHVKGR